MFDALDAQAGKTGAPEQHGRGGIRRLKGGQMRYDIEPAPQQQ
jgi:hypothetical protein